jgi:hypothetical protein
MNHITREKRLAELRATWPGIERYLVVYAAVIRVIVHEQGREVERITRGAFYRLRDYKERNT